jgi:hypothetical protein
MCIYIQEEFVQNKILMGLKIWSSWDRRAQKPIGNREQCAQKPIKSLRGPAAEASLFSLQIDVLRVIYS